MSFREITKEFFKESAPFFVWGCLLMMAFHFIPISEVKQELKVMFFECTALKTICALLFITMLSCGFHLLIFGTSNKFQLLREIYVRRAVYGPTKFGITFSAIAFGLFNGLSLAALITGDYKTSLKVFSTSLYLLAIAFLFWFVASSVSHNKIKYIIAGYERILGVGFIVASPIMFFAVKYSV